MDIYSYTVSAGVKQLYESKVYTVCLLINKRFNLNVRICCHDQYIECNSKWNTNFIEIEIEKSRNLGIDIIWNGEKPWATKYFFINYVLIRNDYYVYFAMSSAMASYHTI